MKIERKTYRDGNLYPEAFNYLKSLPENIDYYKAHIERHPLSIYDLSIQRVREHLTCAMSINAYSSQKLENLEPDHKEK
jgi:hypothetical protein